MNVTITQEKAALFKLHLPQRRTLVSACYYLGMGENQILDILRRGSQSKSWANTVACAKDIGFDEILDVINVSDD